MRRARFLFPLALACALLSLGCASGTVHTSQGERPAAVVEAQDNVADILKILDDGYKAAVAKHDATPVCGPTTLGTCEPEAVHAEHRKVLLRERAALRLSWDGLIAWKRSTSDVPPAALFTRELAAATPDFLDLAGAFGVMSPTTIERVKKFLAVFLGTNALTLPGGFYVPCEAPCERVAIAEGFTYVDSAGVTRSYLGRGLWAEAGR